MGCGGSLVCTISGGRVQACCRQCVPIQKAPASSARQATRRSCRAGRGSCQNESAQSTRRPSRRRLRSNGPERLSKANDSRSRAARGLRAAVRQLLGFSSCLYFRPEIGWRSTGHRSVLETIVVEAGIHCVVRTAVVGARTSGPCLAVCVFFRSAWLGLCARVGSRRREDLSRVRRGSGDSEGSRLTARNVRSIDADCVQCGYTPGITKEPGVRAGSGSGWSHYRPDTVGT